ncbi:YitT family protein [Aquimarina sp. D1M17]|uniref:YitT family protein n=1 Tax=Aquimarina acroporae TaxID=2937283 RepID=UPI0020C11DF0|nr:YitT family protein [Aquimarina acroporae]MCK8521312.1 YitT family protein [Aquimarina acroporae]
MFKSLLSEYVQIFIGILLASIGLKAFLLPNGFLDGGVTGIAILLNSNFDINISWILIVLSIPFLILAFFSISKTMVLKSIVAIITLAIMIEFETFETITDDKLLISIFGGLFLGLGIGITVKNGAVLDGTEILAIYINNRFGISIGRVILLFNFVLFSITAIIASKEVAMYSILTFLVTAKITDLTIEGFEDFIGVMIVSKHSQIIKKQIVDQIGAGMTIYKGVNGFGNSGKIEDFEVIHTVINRMEISKINRLINHIDPNAFVMEYDVNRIKGGILKRYLGPKPNTN